MTLTLVRCNPTDVFLSALEQHGPAAGGRAKQDPGAPAEQRVSAEVTPGPGAPCFLSVKTRVCEGTDSQDERLACCIGGFTAEGP